MQIALTLLPSHPPTITPRPTREPWFHQKICSANGDFCPDDLGFLFTEEGGELDRRQ